MSCAVPLKHTSVLPLLKHRSAATARCRRRRWPSRSASASGGLPPEKTFKLTQCIRAGVRRRASRRASQVRGKHWQLAGLAGLAGLAATLRVHSHLPPTPACQPPSLCPIPRLRLLHTPAGFYSAFKSKLRNLQQGCDTTIWLCLQVRSRLAARGRWLLARPCLRPALTVARLPLCPYTSHVATGRRPAGAGRFLPRPPPRRQAPPAGRSVLGRGGRCALLCRRRLEAAAAGTSFSLELPAGLSPSLLHARRHALQRRRCGQAVGGAGGPGSARHACGACGGLTAPLLCLLGWHPPGAAALPLARAQHSRTHAPALCHHHLLSSGSVQACTVEDQVARATRGRQVAGLEPSG